MRKLSAEARRQERVELYADLDGGRVSIADAVRRMRLITGMTQTEFAERIAGISRQALARIERGEGNPSLRTLEAIGEAFGLELGYQRSRR